MYPSTAFFNVMDRKPRILLTEDDPNFGAVLRDYLELNNFDVTLCSNGATGLNMSQKKDFDLPQGNQDFAKKQYS